MQSDRASSPLRSECEVGDAGAVTPCTSTTHVHMLAALRAELHKIGPTGVVRILDVGCGRGALMGYLHATMRQIDPNRVVELHGFDIAEPGVQRPEFLVEGIRELAASDPTTDWASRLMSISVHDAWPYAAESFDFVISNQVLEHVADHHAFFAQLARVLKPNAVALHCFPVKESVWEPHLHLPGVHWLAGHEQRKNAIKALSRLRLGLFPQHQRKTGISLDRFAERHADFLNLYTNYLCARQMLAVLKRHRLRGSFAYTGGLFAQKLRGLVHAPYRLQYAPAADRRPGVPMFWLLKRLASVTLRVEKADAYRGSFG